MNTKTAEGSRNRLVAKSSLLMMSVCALALATGCTTAGLTTFSDSVDQQTAQASTQTPATTKPQAASANENYAVALAPKGVVDATRQSQPESPELIATAANSDDAAPIVLGSPQPSSDQGGPLTETAFLPTLDESKPEPTAEELRAQATLDRIERLYGEVKHGKCKGGWGTQARTLDANRYTPGDPYYIEIRMRHTPPLPVGHTYTAYGRLDENGKKLDEHLVMLAPVGGYAGATVAATVPVTSKMEPTLTDCIMQPTAAYRVSLSAEQYESLLREIKQAKIDQPKYALWNYNCNHFTSRISESVGIRAPRNKYTASVVYMYDIMRENEGSNYRPRGIFQREVAANRGKKWF